MKKTILILFLVFCLFLSACGKQASVPNSDYSGVKVLRECSNPVNTLNPHNYKNFNEKKKINLVCGNLLSFLYNDELKKGKFYPAHAREMPSKDSSGLVWTIKLRDNIKFDDGTKIDAFTYEESYKILLNPKTKNIRAKALFSEIPVKDAKNYYLGNADWDSVGIKAVDSETLQITLQTQTSDLNFYMCFTEGRGTSPIHLAIYNDCWVDKDKTENTYGSSMEKMPSSGPYKFVKWIRGQYMKLEKVNDYILADKFNPDIIESRLVIDKKTRMQLFESDNVDVAEVYGDNYDRYADDPRIVTIPKYSIVQFIINQEVKDKPYLSDLNLRKALYYSIHREKLAKDVFKVYDPASFIVPRGVLIDYDKKITYRDTEEAKSVVPKNNGYDVDYAIECFNKAYDKYNNMEIVITYAEGTDQFRRLSEILKNEWETLFGEEKIKVKLQMVPWNTILNRFKTGEFEIAPSVWNTDVFNPFSLMQVYTSDYTRKQDNFKSKRFDDLFYECTKGEFINDNKAKLKSLVEMESLILSELPCIPLFNRNEVYIYNNRINHINDGKYIPEVEMGYLQAEIEPYQKSN